MILDAHLNNANSVHNMKKKITLVHQLEVKSKPLTYKSMTAHFRFKHEKGWS